MRTAESSRTLAISADATLVGALVADPFTGIVIPFVALVGDGPERCLDIVPSPLIVESAANQLCDESAASPASGPLVEFGNELVINGYVQSHVLTIAHWLSASLHLPHPAVGLADPRLVERHTHHIFDVGTLGGPASLLEEII
jgi:hypothetical protein